MKFKRSDAGQLRVFALDHNGHPIKTLGHAESIALDPTTLYDLIRP